IQERGRYAERVDREVVDHARRLVAHDDPHALAGPHGQGRVRAGTGRIEGHRTGRELDLADVAPRGEPRHQHPGDGGDPQDDGRQDGPASPKHRGHPISIPVTYITPTPTARPARTGPSARYRRMERPSDTCDRIWTVTCAIAPTPSARNSTDHTGE